MSNLAMTFLITMILSGIVLGIILYTQKKHKRSH